MREINRLSVAALALLSATGARADGGCTIGRIVELPVTMDEMGPMVDAKINGQPVRLMADSGSFFSMLSPGSARMLHLPTQALPYANARGIGGSFSVGLASTKAFTLGGVDIPHVHFLVGGSQMRGAGVIGQEMLGFADVEYDLPHGAVRLMKARGCGNANMAYWSTGRSSSMLAIQPPDARNPHTVGTIVIDGKSIRATFDTGASTTLLSLAAAARIGLKPGAPGVTDGGVVLGFGHRVERTWIGPVDTIAIGDGEQIHHARIRFGATDSDFDMLIGADFFIAHRVYVDNARHRLFLTYEGGPVFNLKAHYEGPEPAAALAAAPAAAASAPSAGADALSRDGAVAMARDDLDAAIADYSKAIAAAPGEARYRLQRAEAYVRLLRTDLAMADLDEAVRLAPGDVDLRVARAGGLLRKHDRAAALADLDAADRAADLAAVQRLALGSMLVAAGQPARAVGQYDRWLKAHPDDVRRASALNGRCWARALAGTGLDEALRDCNAALRLSAGNADILDSRGVAELRAGQLAMAKADFDAALARQPRLAWSLYGRGLIRRKTGDEAGGKADIAAAIALRPSIVEDATGYGITL